MNVKVRCCCLGAPAADNSIIPVEPVEEWLRSDDYKNLRDNHLGLGYLTHRGRSVETASENMANVSMLKKTVGKDDLGLIVHESAPAYTHYIKEFFIETYKGKKWLCAELHILDESGFDEVAKENIKRLKGLINQGVKLPVSLVVLAYWYNEPGSHQDIAKKIKTIKSCDFTANPSFGTFARIYEVTDENGNVIDKEKEFSVTAENQVEGVFSVKTFSDLSGFDLSNTPKTSKVNGQFTTFKVKEFSCFGEVDVLEGEEGQKEFTAAGVKDRLRDFKLGSPRMTFRRLCISYKQVVRQLGKEPKPEDIKILKSMFTNDLLLLLNQITPEVLKGKQINTLLGCSSLSKTARTSAQKLQLDLRYALREMSKQGFVSKLRFQKLQDSYMTFTKSLVEDIFGNPDEIIPGEEEGGENGEN